MGTVTIIINILILNKRINKLIRFLKINKTKILTKLKDINNKINKIKGLIKIKFILIIVRI
jgi:hypothetical protein